METNLILNGCCVASSNYPLKNDWQVIKSMEIDLIFDL